jgi:hypothetical protein
MRNLERMVRAFLGSVFPLSTIFLHLSGFKNLTGVKNAVAIGAN